MGKEIFNTELSRIKNDSIRMSTEKVLDSLPEYFYHMPASTSGRYHPDYTLGDGGLARHIKVAARNLEEMLRNEAFGVYDDDTKDLMRMAIILHDGFKSGLTYSEQTAPEHPVLMSEYILSHRCELGLSAEDAATVARLIVCHMGPWNKNKAGEEIMPVPKERDELIIHTCDYYASRKYLNVEFVDNEIADGTVKRIGVRPEEK